MVDVITKAQDIVLQEIKKIRGPKKDGGDNISILCPSPKHRDSRPSCNIYVGPPKKSVGIGHAWCFSCGFNAPWNTVAELLNLQPISLGDSKHTQMRKKVSDDIRKAVLPKELTMSYLRDEMDCGVSIPMGESEVWRKLPGELLNRVGAEKSFDMRKGSEVLIFPVWVKRRLVGAIKAVWEKEDGSKAPSYLNSEGKWTRELGLFPFDFTATMAKSRGYVVVVEGPRDALRLLSLGIPAVAILGTQNLSENKIRVIHGLRVRVVLCMDGDLAGVRASNKWRKVEREMFGKPRCSTFRLKDWSDYYTEKEQAKAKAAGDKHWADIEISLDPCNMPMRVVKKLLEVCDGGE